MGVFGEPNTAGLVSHHEADASVPDSLMLRVFDAAGAMKQFQVFHDFAPGTDHAISAGVRDGTPYLQIDGDYPRLVKHVHHPITERVSGTGLGSMSQMPATIYVGGAAGVGSGNWVVGHFSVTDTATLVPAHSNSLDFLVLSDSIWNQPDDLGALYPTVDEMLAPAAPMYDFGTYGGNTVGAGLFELADATFAFDAGQWREKQRGHPLEMFNAIFVEFMRNDAGGPGEPVQAYRRALDRIVYQARATKIVLGNCPPWPKADYSAWDLSDLATANGYRDAMVGVASRWNVGLVDTYSSFLSLAPGTYSIRQLMRDVAHPTYGTGSALIAAALVSAYHETRTMNDAIPEIEGKVENYLFGSPVSGTWAMDTSLISSTGPYKSPLHRVAGLPDAGNVVASSGARLAFPAFRSKGRGQVWAHFYVDSASGGTVKVLIDRGSATESSVTYPTRQDGLSLYFHSVLIADDLAQGTHPVEMETTTSDPVRVVGVTYVGGAD